MFIIEAAKSHESMALQSVRFNQQVSITVSDEVKNVELGLLHIDLTLLWNVPVAHLHDPVVFKLHRHASRHDEVLFIWIRGVLFVVEAETGVASLIEDAHAEDHRLVRSVLGHVPGRVHGFAEVLSEICHCRQSQLFTNLLLPLLELVHLHVAALVYQEGFGRPDLGGAFEPVKSIEFSITVDDFLQASIKWT